ncbi:MAG: methyltransferase domain-containing protein [Bacteroidota bacterium]
MNKESIYDLFIKAYNNDKAFIKKWIVSWDYQIKRNKRDQKYSQKLPDDFLKYQGEKDLVKWMKWFLPVYPDYIGTERLQHLIHESIENDKRIISELGLEYDFSDYHLNVGLNNAHDFFIPQMIPAQERYKIKNVLDFGAGYGRQANLWSAASDSIYMAMDAIPNSYCLQNVYFHKLGKPVYDYAENPSDFKFDNDKKGIYHLPTWRYDLIPDNSFDLVICLQVLPELNSILVKAMLRQFNRILKPGGMLYIRDNAYSWKPAGKVNVENFLQHNNFVLEYKAHVIDNIDIVGVPRLWRKTDPKVTASQMYNFNHKMKQFVIDADAFFGGRLKRVKNKISK